jgi:hypothetical protein
MTVPTDVRVVKLFCKATLGGHFKRTSAGGRVYVGGAYIKPIIDTFLVGSLARRAGGWFPPPQPGSCCRSPHRVA